MDSARTSVDLIDDEGNLFGVVNIVDALVVLLVIAVGVAGVSLVLTSDQSSSDVSFGTVNATLDLGTQPEYIVAEINEGDSYSPDGDSTVTVTDVYLSQQDDQIRTVLRVQLNGTRSGDSVGYNGAPPRLGREIQLVTETYSTAGTIRSKGGSDELTVETQELLLKTRLQSSTARELNPGQPLRVHDRQVGTVESVTTYGTDDPDQKLAFVGLTVQTLTDGDQQYFGATPLSEGKNMSVPIGSSVLQGQIARVGATTQRGEPATRNVTFEMTGVSPTIAEAISPGMAESASNDTIARITSVDRENASVIVTGQDGNVYERDHPVKEDVTFTANLAVRETASGVTFKGRTLQMGRIVTLDFGSVTIEARVTAGYR